MIQFICLFCTSFISLLIYIRKNKEIHYISCICYYFLFVLSNCFIMNAILYFVFRRNEIAFTLLFSEKYIFISSILAFFIPKLFEVANRLFCKIKQNKVFFSDKLNRFIAFFKKETVKNNLFFLICMLCQFLFFDIVLRVITYRMSGFYAVFMFTPNLLTIAYALFVGVVFIIFPKKVSKILFVVVSIFNFILFIVNYMLLLIKSRAFSVYDLQIASEGFEYLNFVLQHINFFFLLCCFISVLLFVFTLIKMKNIQCNLKLGKRFVCFIFALCFFLFLRFLSVGILEDYQEDGWSDIAYPKYYTKNLINSCNSLSVLGLYDYTFRDFSNYVLSFRNTYGSKEKIEKIISSNIKTEENDKTGLFKNKNVIMIMMESIDNVIVDKKTMPTLSYMKQNGWDFTKRYSQLNSGGSTIATEYSTMTGLFYTHDKRYDVNDYSEALPNIFAKNHYNVSSFHENKGIYYNRIALHKNFGFRHSYFLLDMNLKDYRFYNDEQFFDNDELYDLVVPKNSKDPFMSFIVTIAPHGPYVNNQICIKNKIENENDCLRFLSQRTDNMLKRMLERLEEDELLDDTVIILYSDHAAYDYHYQKQELVDTYDKIDRNYKIKNLPFVIYTKDIDSKVYDDILVNDIDFPPTILNLFGLSYDAKYYVGTDIFSESRKNICMFNDSQWYDGNVYSAVAKKDDYFKQTSAYVKERLDFSKMIISNDYYKSVHSVFK